MSSLIVFGGSGYAGSHIVEAAAVRGVDVGSVTRKESAAQIAGASYAIGSLLDPAARARALDAAKTVIVAVSPRGDMAGKVRAAVAELAAEAEAANVRLGVIGGAGSLLTEAGGSRLLEQPDFSQDYIEEAREMAGVLDDLLERKGRLDWFFVSPPPEFGAYAAGEYRGEYRIGGDVPVADDEGRSTISGADFGVAVVDEVEAQTHHRARFTVGY